MRAKALLKSARTCILHISYRQQEIDELRSLLLPSGIRYDTDKVQASPDGGSMSDAIARVLEVEVELNKEKGAAADIVNRALRLINSIEQPELRRLLRLRYIDCQSWMRIVEDMHYSESMVYKLHRSALLEADRKAEEITVNYS